MPRYTNEPGDQLGSARLVSELELARLAREPKHKNTLYRDYNYKLATNTSHAYLKKNKQNPYEFWTRLA